MKVTFVYPNGREKVMTHQMAALLQKVGKGIYMTRDMQADSAPAVVVEDVPAEPKKRGRPRKVKEEE